MIPRPPKSPTRTEVPAEKCPAVSAAAATSVSPNSLAAVHASVRGIGRPQRCTSQHQTLIAIAAAWVLQTKLRVGRWDACASSGVDDSLRTARLRPIHPIWHLHPPSTALRGPKRMSTEGPSANARMRSWPHK
eukprot:2221842-Pyramimonas_sp.AAC.1